MMRGAFLTVDSNDEECTKLRLPVLLIAGEEDAQWLEPSRKLHQLIPGRELQVIPAAGHLAHLEQPERTSQAISSFLDGLRS